MSADVSWPTHAADSFQLIRIDLVAVKERLKDMEAQHLTDDEKTSAGLVADNNDLMKAALHLHFAFGYARRLDEVAGDGRET